MNIYVLPALQKVYFLATCLAGGGSTLAFPPIELHSPTLLSCTAFINGQEYWQALIASGIPPAP